MKAEEFESRCRQLGLRITDFRENFSRSSGPGGQNVNKVSTAVELVHLPSGLSVRVQDSRFQGMNRTLARERLLELFAAKREEQRLSRLALISKARRQKAKRSRSTKRKMVEAKRHRSGIKQNRRARAD
ncbi:MAG: peptide chain release factor-like protein [Verrucomicrobiales bacterium]|jgi:protein subunit release factor B|nr:peptide chain release factor-like protein [Verrucomicrobiales bacterium]